jgi:predicted RNA methylase
VFKNLQLRPGEDVFIDYGSGMGRVAIVAATYPFRRVIGVELSPELNSIADANLRRVKSKLKCQDVQFIAIDARSYILHPDVTIIYCFSPFGEEVISKIVDNIHRSLTNNPRKLTIVYCNPRIYEKVISNCDWLIKRWEFQRWDNIRFVAYESRPEAFQPPVTPT